MTKAEPAISLSVGEVTLAVETKGPAGGPLVVLLHGGGQTRHSWRGMRDLLADAGYCVLLYDARGHGDSTWAPSGDYSFDAMAGDLAALIARQGRPAALVGASLGGLTAMVALARQPSFPCWALALVDVVPRMNAAGRNRVLDFMAAHPDGFASPEEALVATSAFVPYRRAEKESGSGLARNLRKRGDRFYWHWDPAFLSDRVAEGGAFPAVEPALRAAAFPILLVRGELSDVVTETEAADFIAAVPNAALKTVPKAAHMVTGDRNDIFAAAIKSFLDDACGAVHAAPGVE